MGTNVRTCDTVCSVQFIWPRFHHVFGKPRRPNVQGAVERVNREIGRMIMCWIAEHNSLGYLAAISSLQVALALRPNSRMKACPAEIMFGKRHHNRMAEDFGTKIWDAAAQKDMTLKGSMGAHEHHLLAAAPKSGQFAEAMERSRAFVEGGFEEDYKHITEHRAPGLAQWMGSLAEVQPEPGLALNTRRVTDGIMTTYMDFGEVRLCPNVMTFVLVICKDI
jgi:hypothetical protein